MKTHGTTLCRVGNQFGTGKYKIKYTMKSFINFALHIHDLTMLHITSVLNFVLSCCKGQRHFTMCSGYHCFQGR